MPRGVGYRPVTRVIIPVLLICFCLLYSSVAIGGPIFQDDFSSTLSSWTLNPASDASFSIVDGELRQFNTAPNIPYNDLYVPSGFNWQNYRVTFKTRHVSGFYSTTSLGVIVRRQQDGNLRASGGYWIELHGEGFVQVFTFDASGNVDLLQKSVLALPVPNAVGYQVQVDTVDDRLQVWVDGVKYIDLQDSTYRTGSIGLFSVHVVGGFDDVVVTSLSFQPPGSFVFSPISSPVEPNTCFPVRIEARTAGGTLDTTVNGDVSLSANFGGVSPNILPFTNGVASNTCVKLIGGAEGKNIQLTAQGAGLSEKSNFFDTTVSCNVWVDLHLVPYPNTTAILYDAAGTEVGRTISGIGNRALFGSVPCGGSYRVRVEKGTLYKDDVIIDVSENGVYKEISLPVIGAQGTPVILIPGILGSTRKDQYRAPLLGPTYPDARSKLEFFWPSNALGRGTGWNDFEEELVDAGYSVFRCPWDWRDGIGTSDNQPVNMQKNVETYLIPVINEALRASTTGKVHIVAISMGGVLAREYIQSTVYASRNDVENLALVGVPNLGSANSYFLWEAGDIDTGTKIFGNSVYGDTAERMWRESYGLKTLKKCDSKSVRKFLQEKSPSMRQLLFTDNFLLNETLSSTAVAITSPGYENVWLKELNSGKAGMYKKPEDVFSIDGAGDKVKTRLFLGNTAFSTLRIIKVGSKSYKYPDGTTYYPDGKPLDVGPMTCSDAEQKKEATDIHIMRYHGDKTVPIESAMYPMTAGWADRDAKVSNLNHASLIQDFKPELIAFLGGGGDGVTTEPGTVEAKQKTVAQEAAEPVEPMLAFSVIGKAGILVTDSQGRRSGVTPDTHEPVNEIPGTAMNIDEMAASVSIKNVAAGQYRLTYYGLGERELSLDISASNTVGEVQTESFEGFKPDAPQTMTVVYDAAASDFLVVQPVVAAPQELETEPYTCGASKCVRLKWKASVGAGVTQNVVYRALVNTPFYAEHTRLPATILSYDTGEPWDTVNEIPVNGYAVSAIKADSVESFFAENKEGECAFPWPMFLPAITHGTQHP